MYQKNKKLSLIVSLGFVFLILIASGIAFGHNEGNSTRMCNYNLQSWNTQLPDEYSFNSDQIKEIETILEGCNKDLMPLNQKLSSLRMEMKEYSNRSDTDFDKIDSYRDKIRKIENDISDLRFKTNKRVNKLLSDNQRNYFGMNFDWCDFDFENMNGMNKDNMNDMCMDNWKNCEMHKSYNNNMNDMCMNNWKNCDMHKSYNNNMDNNNMDGCCR